MRFRLLTVVSGAWVAVMLAACSLQSDSGGRATAEDAAQGPSSPAAAPPGQAQAGSPHPYVGMWVTADGHIRQELLPNGRYDEARGERQSAYTGSYRVSGTRIDYVDDTGFTADGTFDGDVLHHGGYVFYRQGSDALKRATETGP
jgi:hypothetical protein